MTDGDLGVSIPYKPGLVFSLVSTSPISAGRSSVSIPYKPGLVFSPSASHRSLRDNPYVSIPYKPGLVFSRGEPLPIFTDTDLFQSRISPVSYSHKGEEEK